MGRVAGRTALVTGAAMGIGAAIARRLAEEGASVCVADIDAEKGQAVAGSLGGESFFQRLDVTVEDDWKAAITAIRARFGRLDIAVNNAGISEPGPVDVETFAHWQRVQSINADSVFLGSHYCLNLIRETATPEQMGSIVNISSSLALKAGALLPAYCASKASVHLLTKSMALRCGEAKYPVRCNTVHPGAVRTPMYERYLDMGGDREAADQAFISVHPIGRVGEPEDIANAVLFLSSDEASFITGAQLSVDGGVSL